MSNYIKNGKSILKKLKSNGYEAYFVGGFVRDYISNQVSNDIDITTNATPKEVLQLFPKAKHTGRNFGGVTVFIGDDAFELTTYRLEGKYKQHRFPSDVTFSMNIEEDVIRRDFTMNGLIMDEHEKIYDYVNGKQDIEQRLIRTIGDPKIRFLEDALRMLRAFRFVSKIGFDIEQQTLQAIFEHKQLIQTISIERVMQELDKIIRGPFRQKALAYMVSSQFHTVLYGLQQGIEYTQTINQELYPLEFFIISFILNDIDDIWCFSNKDSRLIMQVLTLHEVTKEEPFNKYILFSNKLEPCLLTNRINVLMGYPDQEPFIRSVWDEMAVKDVCDLAFKGQDILELTTLKKRSVIGLVIDDLLHNVLMGIMPNEYEPLKTFALQRIAELQKELGEHYE